MEFSTNCPLFSRITLIFGDEILANLLSSLLNVNELAGELALRASLQLGVVERQGGSVRSASVPNARHCDVGLLTCLASHEPKQKQGMADSLVRLDIIYYLFVLGY